MSELQTNPLAASLRNELEKSRERERQLIRSREAWKRAALMLESLSNYDQIEPDDDCELALARKIEEEMGW